MVHVGQKLDTGSIGQFWLKISSGDSHTVIGARSEVGVWGQQEQMGAGQVSPSMYSFRASPRGLSIWDNLSFLTA